MLAQRGMTMWRGMGTTAVVVVVCVAAGGRCLGDEIILRGSVRLSPAAHVVRLADIAEISGPEAKRYAEMVIARIVDPARVVEIPVGDVRALLDEAGVHWGKVQLSGRMVIVRPRRPDTSSPPLAMTPASVKTSARTRSIATASTLATDLIELPTLRGTVARALVQGLGIAPGMLRLTFNDHGREILDLEEDAARFEIEPLSNLHSDRIELTVRAWSGGRIQQRHSLTVHPLLSTEVVVLVNARKRGDEIRESDCSVETRWLAPSQAALMAGFIEVVGRVADTRLKAGDVLRTKHVKREVLIRRGQRVMVRCLVGGIVISLEAEARSDGADGEQVELRKLGERDTFFATATGPGSAVVDLGS